MSSHLDRRALLSGILHEFCDNVYYQPPANKSLVYPCIVYSVTGIHRRKADNTNYTMKREYEVTYISKNPDALGPDGDTGFIESLLNRLDNIRYVRRFTSDNLYHDVFDLYF